jgi:hypothetical protein
MCDIIFIRKIFECSLEPTIDSLKVKGGKDMKNLQTIETKKGGKR